MKKTPDELKRFRFDGGEESPGSGSETSGGDAPVETGATAAEPAPEG